MDKHTPLSNFFYGFKWITSLASMIVGLISFIFGTFNADVDGAYWFAMFGFFFAWCGYSLKESLKKELAIRDREREDDDEGSNDTLRPA